MTDAPVVLITGAGWGIGRASAELLSSHGYRVFGTSRHPEQHGTRSFPLLTMDVHSDESVSNCVERILLDTGRIDILINNAGTGIAGAAEETVLTEARTVFETNLFGMMRVTNAVLPGMRHQRYGKIITMSSVGGFVGFPFRTSYVASKFALEGYCESLRFEVRPFGVFISLVEPGAVRTPIADAVPRVRQEIAAYAVVRNHFTEKFNSLMRQGMPPHRVARVIQRIVEEDSPRLRYTVGTQTTILATLRRVMPQQGFEILMRRIFGI